MIKSTLSNVYRCPKTTAAWVGNEAVFGYSQDGNLSICILDVPPYLFTIYHGPNNGPRTLIEKRLEDLDSGRIRQIDRKKVLDVAKALDLPWHDKEQVIQRVQTLVLFS